jgi:hypothetical protein
MIRTRLVLAVAVMGALGLWHMSWGQSAAPPTASNAPRAGYAPARIGWARGQGLNIVVDHPVDGQLNQEIDENVEKLSNETDAAKKADLEKEIKAGLAKQFDSRQAAREQELKDLEERIKQLRGQFDKRQKAKDEIIESRFQELVRAANGLGWGEEANAGPYGAVFQSIPGGLPAVPFAPTPTPARR